MPADLVDAPVHCSRGRAGSPRSSPSPRWSRSGCGRSCHARSNRSRCGSKSPGTTTDPGPASRRPGRTTSMTQPTAPPHSLSTFELFRGLPRSFSICRMDTRDHTHDDQIQQAPNAVPGDVVDAQATMELPGGFDCGRFQPHNDCRALALRQMGDGTGQHGTETAKQQEQGAPAIGRTWCRQPSTGSPPGSILLSRRSTRISSRQAEFLGQSLPRARHASVRQSVELLGTAVGLEKQRIHRSQASESSDPVSESRNICAPEFSATGNGGRACVVETKVGPVTISLPVRESIEHFDCSPTGK